MADEQERGRIFDYFIALLFAQIEDVECVAKRDMQRGEVDVLADFTDASQRLHRLTGNFVPIENKWENSATKQREIHIHHRKAEWISLQSSCLVSCFVSMAGFTSDAEQEITHCQNPKMIALVHEDIDYLVNAQSVGDALRKMIS
ncbi:hypothetical protein [Salinigranum sp. GCM10025319]|uniref:hypothetical protein n=1 Tax=Salinigranum sp. GCM10025319 TaxID=3252687 RepID=UPI00361201BA